MDPTFFSCTITWIAAASKRHGASSIWCSRGIRRLYVLHSISKWTPLCFGAKVESLSAERSVYCQQDLQLLHQYLQTWTTYNRELIKAQCSSDWSKQKILLCLHHSRCHIVLHWIIDLLMPCFRKIFVLEEGNTALVFNTDWCISVHCSQDEM